MKKLLVVDDAEEVRAFISRVLAIGFEIISARDGEEALEIISRERPDLVLLDIWMPGMGGIKTLERIQAIDPSIPVMVMTSVDDPAVQKQTFKLGAREYMAKPMDTNYLETMVLAQTVGLTA